MCIYIYVYIYISIHVYTYFSLFSPRSSFSEPGLPNGHSSAVKSQGRGRSSWGVHREATQGRAISSAGIRI